MKTKTIFIDIDGTIIEHKIHLERMISEEPILLPGVLEFIEQMKKEDAHIIIVTARPEEHREITIKQLTSIGVTYDRLIMGLPKGERWIINDTKPEMDITARAFVINRNSGLCELLYEA